MKIHKTLMPFGIALLLVACGGGPESTTTSDQSSTDATSAAKEEAPKAAAEPTAFPDDFIKASDIVPPAEGPINQDMLAEAKEIFNAKCSACHGLTEQKVIGPGWKGVFGERSPEWLMNMMLHTEWMIENDADAQALVEETGTVMPDQELTTEQARAMLELIRSL